MTDTGAENIARCQECGRVGPHTIARLNRLGQPVLCDRCHGSRA